MKLIPTSQRRSFYRVLKVMAIAVLGTIATISVPLTFLHERGWALVSLICIVAAALCGPEALCAQATKTRLYT